MKLVPPTLPRRAVALAALSALMPAAEAVDYNWASGTFVSGVTAPNPLAAADTLNILTGGFKFFDGPALVFTNLGTVNWSTTNGIYMQNGASVVNNNVWDSTADHQLFYNGGATPSFTNNSVFRKSAGPGNVTIDGGVNFINNGTLDARSGSIVFNGGATFNSGTAFIGAGSNVIAAGSHTFNGSISSSNLRLDGGTFAGNSAELGGGGATLNGGTLAGNWTIAGPTTLTAGAGAFKYIEGNVVNNGTVNWGTTNFWYLQNGGSFTNNALFSAAQSTSIVYNGGAATAFTNSASGTVRAEAGRTLSLGGGLGFVNNGGVLDAAAGATIAIHGGAQLNGGTYSGAGLVTVDGNNSFSGVLDAANLRITNGTQTGNAALLNGTLEWTGGAFAGTFALNAGSTLTAGAGAFKYIDGANFTNNGAMVWNTTNALYLQNGASWVNNGLFTANASTTVFDNGGARPVLDNRSAGTLRAAGGSTLTLNNVLRNNGGRLDAEAASSIRYTGAVFNTGTMFSGAGSHVVTGNNSFNGAINAVNGNLVLESGTQTGSAVALSGNVSWTGGRFEGGWQLAGGSQVAANSGGFKHIGGSGTVFENLGMLVLNTTNLLYLEGTARLQNRGILDIRADTSIVNNGGTPTFINTGLIVKSAGAGTATIGNALGFDNQGGTVDVRSGTLALPTNFSNRGVLAGTGIFSVGGTLTNALGGTLAPGAAGPGTLQLTGSFAQLDGAVFAVDLESLASHDLFNISGSAVLDGALSLTCFAHCSYAVGDVITILDSVGDLSGTFGDNVFLNGFATGAFTVVYDTTADRVQLLVTQSVTAVPEPASFAMLLTGMAALGFAAKRRRA